MILFKVTLRDTLLALYICEQGGAGLDVAKTHATRQGKAFSWFGACESDNELYILCNNIPCEQNLTPSIRRAPQWNTALPA